ncbi:MULTISPECIES: hypothetical protein [unclassified Duganella]|uniref:hypothetical protein n=1 Tax=unclassified Duganella TaxID=2636909 RepID=UPI0006FD69F0|nr:MULTISPECIES: hypothetical protein [unclassified Duganella]KQV53916.1 hypothetical protein ASD07_05045 [Duganella sp. Root336D2]KRB83530.1 hypothetical protein ASE26_10135 [Duganella sp. Root198D2]
MGKLGLGACALLLSMSQGACAALLSSSDAPGAGNAGPDPFELSAAEDGAATFQDGLAEPPEFPFSPPGNAGSLRANLGSMMLDVDPALANNVLLGSKFEAVDDSAHKPAIQALCGISLVVLLAFRAAGRFSGKRRRRRR